MVQNEVAQEVAKPAKRNSKIRWSAKLTLANQAISTVKLPRTNKEPRNIYDVTTLYKTLQEV